MTISAGDPGENTAPTEAISAPEATPDYLAIFLSGFTIVMALAATAIAAHHATSLFLSWLPLEAVLVVAATTLFFGLLIGLALKIKRHAKTLRRQLRDPETLSLLPVMSVSLLLLAAAFHFSFAEVGWYFWLFGALLQVFFTLQGMSFALIYPHRKEVEPRPAWFLPVIGNLLVPVAGVRYVPDDVSWFFFAMGAVTWLVLALLTVNRMMFHRIESKERAIALLAMMIAPPAIGFIGYFFLMGEVDVLARLMYFTSLFLLFFVAVQGAKLVKLSYQMSGWVYVVPLAAVTIATMVYHMAGGQPIYLYLSIILYAALVAIILGLAARSVIAWKRSANAAPASPQL